MDTLASQRCFAQFFQVHGSVVKTWRKTSSLEEVLLDFIGFLWISMDFCIFL